MDNRGDWNIIDRLKKDRNRQREIETDRREDCNRQREIATDRGNNIYIL